MDFFFPIWRETIIFWGKPEVDSGMGLILVCLSPVEMAISNCSIVNTWEIMI